MKLKVRPKAVIPCEICRRELYGADRYELMRFSDTKDEDIADANLTSLVFCSTKCVLAYYLESREDTLKKVLRDG
jgi:hypothetical protein